MGSSRINASGSSRHARAAVVGAGIAGLAAARTMHDQGFEVHLFDKGRGVGGRISVRRRPPFVFDHGAQFFTACDEQFVRHVRSWRAAGIVDVWSGRIGLLEGGVWRETPSQVRYVGVPGMNEIAKHLAAGLKVKTECRVMRMAQSGERWRLEGQGGTDFGVFDVIVVAIPAPQASALLAGRSPLAQQAAECAMSPCWALMLGFDGPVATSYDAAFVEQSPLAWICRNSSRPGRPTAEAWIAHAGPEWSAEHIEDSAADVADALTTEFRRLLGDRTPEPLFTAAHRWRYALHSGRATMETLWDAEARIAVCGDWCLGARVEDAFLSGIAAASRAKEAMISLTGTG